MKNISFILLLLSAYSVIGSSSLNLIVNENEAMEFADSQPVLLGQNLVYIDHSTPENKVWSYNLGTQQKTDLNLIGAVELIANKQSVVILIPQNDRINVWLSDGTNVGTQLVVNAAISSYTKTKHHLYFTQPNDSVYRVDGTSSSRYVLPNTQLIDGICESADGNRFALANEQFSMQGPSRYYMVGDLFNSDPLVYINSQRIKSFNGFCYGFLNEAHDYQNKWVIKELITDGSVVSFEDNDFVQNLSNFTVFNDKLYAIEYILLDNSYHIHQLNPETLTSIHAVKIDLFDGYLNNDGLVYPTEYLFFDAPPLLSKNSNYLITGNPFAMLFDENLEPVEIINNTSQSADLLGVEQTDVFQMGDTSVLVKNQNPLADSNKEVEFLSINDNTITNHFKSTKNKHIKHVFSSSFNDKTTLLMQDNKNQKKGFYEVSESPKISHNINGSWYNPSYKSQGLSISKGLRQDQSEYVFLTAYLFRDGKPLWVAGTADLENSPENLNIQLFEFNGLQLLETNQPANRVLFGSIDLQLTDCHSLQTTINSPDGSDDITFYRAENTGVEDWCQ